MLCFKFTLLTVLIAAPGLLVSGENVITCDGEIHYLFCTEGTILVDSTTYGRTDSSTCDFECLPQEYMEQGCIENVTTIGDRCNGMPDCKIKTKSFDMSNSCKGKYNYYNTTYSCRFDERSEVCEGDSAWLQCAQGTLNIISAHYGRTDSTTCTSGTQSSELANTDCHAPNTLDVVKNSCQGNFVCTMNANDTVFTDPCPDTTKYLTITYSCEEVQL